MGKTNAKKPRIIVVVGPTATGKSDLAVRIAKKVQGEVISADSRQVYRGLDIGTGKITKREMRGIPHHMLDIVPAKRVFTAVDFQREGERVIREVLSRGRTPIICGGSGYYIRGLVEGIRFPDVKEDQKFRSEVTGLSSDELFRMLNTLDPEFAKVVDRRNPRRLVRAIEIARALGKVPPFSTDSPYETLYIGITCENDVLRERIRARLQKRMKGGMLAEVKTLHQKELSWRRMEDLGLEYRYLSRFLRKKISRAEMLTELENEIMKYAKRQKTWWKKDARIYWFPLGKLKDAELLACNFVR